MSYYGNQQYGGGQNYGPPPPQAPPGYNTISLPPGWVSQFDLSAQRWFYIEQSSGRTQWEAPSGGFQAQGGYQDASRGFGAPGGGYDQSQYGNPNPGGYPQGEPREEKSDKSGMLLAAAGGLAVGAIGGALIANALGMLPYFTHWTQTNTLADDDDEDEERRAAAAAQYTDVDGMPPAILGARDADGESVSSSDREDVQEAREEYEEALADAADSDASSSDEEALEEASQEYAEQYEDTYGRDD